MRTATKLEDSVKYYAITKTNNNLLLSIDWLEFNLLENFPFSKFGFHSGDEAQRIEGSSFKISKFEFIHSGRSSKNFKHIITVFYKGIEFASLQYSSNKSFLHGSMFLKIANHIFYTKDIRLQNVLHQLLKLLKTRVLNVVRLDLAADGAELDEHFTDLFFQESVYKEVNQFKINVPYGGVNRNKTLNSVQLGSRSSTRKFCVYYNKTKEYNESSRPKEYIKKFHELNGYDYDKQEVKRFEIRLRSQFFKELKNFSYHKIFNPEYLLGFFLDAVSSFTTYHKTTDKGRVARKNKYKLFFSNMFKFSKLCTFARIKKNKSTKTKKTIKTLCKVLFEQFLYSSNPAHYASMLNRFLSDNLLKDWFKMSNSRLVYELKLLRGSSPNLHLLTSKYFRNLVNTTSI